MKYLLTLYCFIIISFMGTKKSSTLQPSFNTQGHRGCRGLMPENTIPAMLKAIDLGVHTLEMDVVISQDEQVVVSHDAFFNHEITTKPNGDSIGESEEKQFNLYKMTYNQIKSFDVGLKTHPRFQQQSKIPAVKPLLGDLIDVVESYITKNNKPLVFYNIETKSLPETDLIFHPSPAVFCELLMSVINKKGIANRTIIQSFDIRTLKYIRQNYPKIKTALLIDEGDANTLEHQLKELGFVPTIYSPHFSLVTPLLIASCHQKHIQLIPWTVNDVSKIKELKLLGVDGIISDYPNLFNGLSQ